jgi:hypothetical protein
LIGIATVGILAAAEMPEQSCQFFWFAELAPRPVWQTAGWDGMRTQGQTGSI